MLRRCTCAVNRSTWTGWISGADCRADAAPARRRPPAVRDDPKPLFYQFSFERAGTFTWTYLEEGPEVWRVEIRSRRLGMRASGRRRVPDPGRARTPRPDALASSRTGYTEVAARTVRCMGAPPTRPGTW